MQSKIGFAEQVYFYLYGFNWSFKNSLNRFYKSRHRRQPKPCFFWQNKEFYAEKKLQIDLKSIQTILGHSVALEFDFRVQYICRYLILHQFWLDGQRISSSKLCFCTGEIACYYSTFDGKENEKSTIIVKILGFNWLDSPTFRCFQVLGSSIEKIKIGSFLFLLLYLF